MDLELECRKSNTAVMLGFLFFYYFFFLSQEHQAGPWYGAPVVGAGAGQGISQAGVSGIETSPADCGSAPYQLHHISFLIIIINNNHHDHQEYINNNTS